MSWLSDRRRALLRALGRASWRFVRTLMIALAGVGPVPPARPLPQREVAAEQARGGERA